MSAAFFPADGSRGFKFYATAEGPASALKNNIAKQSTINPRSGAALPSTTANRPLARASDYISSKSGSGGQEAFSARREKAADKPNEGLKQTIKWNFVFKC